MKKSVDGGIEIELKVALAQIRLRNAMEIGFSHSYAAM